MSFGKISSEQFKDSFHTRYAVREIPLWPNGCQEQVIVSGQSKLLPQGLLLRKSFRSKADYGFDESAMAFGPPN